MANGSWIIELCQTKDWHSMTEDEKSVFERWLDGASGMDLFLLIHHASSHCPTSAALLHKITSVPPPKKGKKPG